MRIYRIGLQVLKGRLKGIDVGGLGFGFCVFVVFFFFLLLLLLKGFLILSLCVSVID